MMTRRQKQMRSKPVNSGQGGYVLIVTVILLSVLLVMSLGFFKRSADSLQISGYNRESAESLVIAESAMNLLYGRFVYDADLDNDGIKDNEERVNPTKLNELPLPYIYFVSSNDTIDQKYPSILQKIANGEARNSTAAITDHKISSTIDRLMINSLFINNNTHPLVFEFNNLNQLETTSKSWADISTDNSTKAATAWLELVKNENLAGTVQVYVQAVGKAGTSKSYVQRLIGNYPTTLGNQVGGLNESSL